MDVCRHHPRTQWSSSMSKKRHTFFTLFNRNEHQQIIPLFLPTTGIDNTETRNLSQIQAADGTWAAEPVSLKNYAFVVVAVRVDEHDESIDTRMICCQASGTKHHVDSSKVMCQWQRCDRVRICVSHLCVCLPTGVSPFDYWHCIKWLCVCVLVWQKSRQECRIVFHWATGRMQ